MNFHYAMSKTIGGKFKIKNSTRKGLQVGLKAYQKAFLRIIIKELKLWLSWTVSTNSSYLQFVILYIASDT